MYQKHNHLEVRYRFCLCRRLSISRFIDQAGHVYGMKLSHLEFLTVSSRTPPLPVTPAHQEKEFELVESYDPFHAPPPGKYNPRPEKQKLSRYTFDPKRRISCPCLHRSLLLSLQSKLMVLHQMNRAPRKATTASKKKDIYIDSGLGREEESKG